MGRKKRSDYPERLVRLISAFNGLNGDELPQEVLDRVYGFDEYSFVDLPQSVLDFIYWDDHNMPDDNPFKTILGSRSERRPAILWEDVMRLYDDKQMLRQVVKAFDEYREAPDPDVTFFSIGLVNISFQPDSTVTFVSSRALDILTQYKVPVERIRICRECDDLYLIRRSGTHYCPKTKCKTAYHNNLKAIRRDREELELLRDKYRTLRKEWKRYQGKSGWHAKQRVSIERDIAETTKCGLKVRKRIEDRLERGRNE